MEQNKLPGKILKVRDCTFVLPDIFTGTVEDAFNEMLKYRIDNLKNAKYVDGLNLFSTFNILVNRSENKFCGQYAIYELKDGIYIINESTSPK